MARTKYEAERKLDAFQMRYKQRVNPLGGLKFSLEITVS